MKQKLNNRKQRIKIKKKEQNIKKTIWSVTDYSEN